jgi:hypothetical protein
VEHDRVVVKSRNFKPRKLLARWAATVTEISCICTIFRSPSAETGKMPAVQETADIVRIAARGVDGLDKKLIAR